MDGDNNMNHRDELDTIIFARGDIAEAAAGGMLRSLNPSFKRAFKPGVDPTPRMFPSIPKGSLASKDIAKKLVAHRAARKDLIRNGPREPRAIPNMNWNEIKHPVNTDQELYRALHGYGYFSAREELDKIGRAHV